MSAVAERERARCIERAKHRNWSEKISTEPMFKGIVTLDPEGAVDVWGRLSLNTAMLEFQEVPARLHRSFVRALSRRYVKSDGKKR